MLIWLVSQGENLPIETGARMMRVGMLARTLVNRGHSVIWWASTFSHQQKQLLASDDREMLIAPGYTLKLIHAGAYRRNISWQRYRHHRVLASRFRQQARTMPAPDVIVTSFPPIEFADEAVAYAETRRVPVIVDIRDLWPDIFVEKSPWHLKIPVKWVLVPINRRRVRRLLTRTDAVVAASKGYLRWALDTCARPPTGKEKVFHLGCKEDDPEEPHGTGPGRADVGHPEGRVIFTFVGSFGHSYELMTICSAARVLDDMGVASAVFVLAGDGEQYRAITREAASLGNVTLTGWLNEMEIRKLLRRSDVGLVPCKSMEHTVPNKIFEYLSAGLPLLSSLEGEVEELIREKDVGASYKCGDVEALCRHIVRYVRESEWRRRQAENALKLFRREFRAEAIYGAYADHIERIGMDGAAVGGEEAL